MPVKPSCVIPIAGRPRDIYPRYISRYRRAACWTTSEPHTIPSFCLLEILFSHARCHHFSSCSGCLVDRDPCECKLNPRTWNENVDRFDYCSWVLESVALRVKLLTDHIFKRSPRRFTCRSPWNKDLSYRSIGDSVRRQTCVAMPRTRLHTAYVPPPRPSQSQSTMIHPTSTGRTTQTPGTPNTPLTADIDGYSVQPCFLSWVPFCKCTNRHWFVEMVLPRGLVNALVLPRGLLLPVGAHWRWRGEIGGAVVVSSLPRCSHPPGAIKILKASVIALVTYTRRDTPIAK